jgi:hypothetical protein
LLTAQGERVVCIADESEERRVRVVAYAHDGPGATGQRSRIGEICLLSWYENRRISYIDLPGLTKTLVLIEFDGATGTGLRQTVLLGLTWDGRFRPALLETKSFEVSQLGYTENLAVSYRVDGPATRAPAILLSYSYVEATNFPRGSSDKGASYSLRSTWEERLPWNPEHSAFYDAKVEAEKAESLHLAVSARMARVREKILNIDLEALDTCRGYDRLFKATGVMGVLDREER